MYDVRETRYGASLEHESYTYETEFCRIHASPATQQTSMYIIVVSSEESTLYPTAGYRTLVGDQFQKSATV